MNTPSTHISALDWDAYWRNAQSAAAHKEGGPQDEVLERFWSTLFSGIFPACDGVPSVLDLGCGAGAVTRFALSAATLLKPGVELHLVGLDYSLSALTELTKRYPGVSAISADAARPPFEGAVFDIVASQFGVEYAGPDALVEAARMVRPGGILAAVLHLRDGGIFQECRVNLEAIDALRKSRLLPCFEQIFRSAMAVQQGNAGRAEFREADHAFAAAVAASEDVLRKWGKEAADGMLFRLYADIAEMYRRFAQYEPQEVFQWIDRMVTELDRYAGRMESMLRVALDRAAFDRSAERLREDGFQVRIADALGMGVPAVPSAWALVARKATAGD